MRRHQAAIPVPARLPQDHPLLSFARTVGSGLGRAVAGLRGSGSPGFGERLSGWAQRYPERSLSGALVAGFLVGRLLRRL